MIVTVEGLITSIKTERKDNKDQTTVYLVQEGEREQVVVRLPGDKSNLYTTLERCSFVGRLINWKTRDGIGSMVLADV